MVTTKCAECGKEIQRFPYLLKFNNFCTKGCLAASRKKTMSGNKYRSGKSPYNKGIEGVSLKTKLKMSLAKIGKTTWNKGIPQSEKAKELNILSHKGRHLSPKTQFKKGMIPHNFGVPNPSFRGANNPLWKGGVTQKNYAERVLDMATLEYKLWRSAVLKRDNFVCWMCGEYSRQLEAHHVVRWIDNKDLRHDQNNGISLCKSCHKSIQNTESDWSSWFNFIISNNLTNWRYA